MKIIISNRHQMTLAQFRVDCDQAADDAPMQELERLKGASPGICPRWPRHEGGPVRVAEDAGPSLAGPDRAGTCALFHVAGHPHLRLVAVAWAGRFVDGPQSALAAAKAGIDEVFELGPAERIAADHRRFVNVFGAATKLALRDEEFEARR